MGSVRYATAAISTDFCSEHIEDWETVLAIKLVINNNCFKDLSVLPTS